MNKPILGITMGDPFGNGPEITVRAMNDPDLYRRCRPLVVGDVSSMEYALEVAKKVSGISLQLHSVKVPAEAKFEYGTIAVLDMGIPLTDAVACAAINPARVLGIAGEYGTIAAGKRANALLLDQNLHLKAVIKDGMQIK